MIVQKLFFAALALVGLAVAGVGIYRLVIGGNDGDSLVIGGIMTMLVVIFFYSED